MENRVTVQCLSWLSEESGLCDSRLFLMERVNKLIKKCIRTAVTYVVRDEYSRIILQADNN